MSAPRGAHAFLPTVEGFLDRFALGAGVGNAIHLTQVEPQTYLYLPICASWCTRQLCGHVPHVTGAPRRRDRARNTPRRGVPVRVRPAVDEGDHDRPETKAQTLAAPTAVLYIRVLRRCEEVLDRRGEDWAAAVLGRDISRRSLTAIHRPYLLTGEDHTLVAADAEEDRISIAHLDVDG